MSTIDEVFVIQDLGIPLFHWSREDEDNESDDYILQSSLFQALSAFAQEMAQDEIKFVIFEIKSFAIKNIGNYRMKLVFGHFSSDVDLKNSEKFIHETSGFISGFMAGNYPDRLDDFVEKHTTHFNVTIKKHLIKENIIPSPKQDKVLTDEQNRQRVQGFLFKSLGYKPGQCNIGPQERQRKLLTGFGFGALSLLILIGIVYAEGIFTEYAENLRYLRLIIVLPLFMSFQGLYQYFFKFCVTNALKNQYSMK
ncbi:MAG: hypothetical protein ACXACW_02550 [Candidatus Hodarchaeales archaeon]|jgi:hypothetical protein